MVSTSTESSAVGKHRRVLSSQMGQRHTNRAVWVRVLSSMERFLAVALRVWFPTAAEDDGLAYADVAVEAKTVRVGGETSACIALYRNGLEPQPRASAFRLYDGLLSAGSSSSSGRSGAASTSNAGSSSRENAREFALELVPLLLDMWVEADPDSGESMPRNSLILIDCILRVLVPLLLDMWVEADPDSGESMPRQSLILIDCILRVLLLLIEWLRKESPSNVSWFEENFGTLLLNHFDGRFPLSHDCVAGSGQPLTKKAKKDPLFDRQVSVASINLGICEVLAGLLGVLSADQGQQVLAFFGDLISTGQVRSGDTRVVVKIARLLLPRVSPSDCLQLLEAMLSLYEEGDILQPRDARFILDFFHELILGPRTLLDVVRPVVDRFLGLLPERALGDRGEGQEGASLHFLGKLAQLRLPALLESLQRRSLLCIELLPQMSQEKDQRTLVELICRVPSLEKEHFEALYAATLDPLPTSVVLYLLQLLKERFSEEKKGVMYVAAYSSFLLSVATGMSRSKGEQLRAIWRDDSSWLELKELLPEVAQIPVVPIDWDLLPSHLMVIEMVAKSFEAFPASWNLSRIFEPFFQQFLETYPQMSCSAALSLVHLCGRRRSAEQPPWLLSPPWGPLTIGCAAGLLCVAAQLSGPMPTSMPALVQTLAGLATRCPDIFNDLVAQFCQVLDLPLAVPCLELVCGALRTLSKQHLLATPARNHALQTLIGKQGSELRRHPWFLATLSEFCEGVQQQQHHPHQLAMLQPSSITITVRQ
uniref:TEX10-like TPR repeats domain-containing protein n=1 Tax=Rhipicephalus pulchellus TaxID=72859 RepID=L7LX44_RHIPC